MSAPESAGIPWRLTLALPQSSARTLIWHVFEYAIFFRRLCGFACPGSGEGGVVRGGASRDIKGLFVE